MWCIFSYLVSVAYASDWFSMQEAAWSSFLYYGFSLRGAFYFSVGVFLRLKGGRKLPEGLSIVCMAMGLIVIAVKIRMDCLGISCPISLVELAVPLLIYSLWEFVPETEWARWLLSCSFPIYLMHDLILVYLKRCVFPFALRALFLWVLALVFSIAMTVLLRKKAPKVSRILFGGR